MNSKSYSKYIKTIRAKSSFSELTEKELQQLEEELLNKQSTEFVQLYLFVKDLDLSEDELRSIILENVTISTIEESKIYISECEVFENGTPNSLLTILTKILC